MLLFAQETGSGQIVGWTALVATLVTGALTVIGTYLSNRQAARVKADDRDNDDKWRIITGLQQELVAVKKEFSDYRDTANERYDASRESEARCQRELARFEERVRFLEMHLEANGMNVPRKRPDGMSDSELTHRPLPPQTRALPPKQGDES